MVKLMVFVMAKQMELTLGYELAQVLVPALGLTKEEASSDFALGVLLATMMVLQLELE